MVYDGSGGPPVEADVGIAGDRIALVGEGGRADAVIEAGGLAVAPGFIDTHGHSEFSIFQEPSGEGKLLQGVTTEINGNCGLSAAPLLGEALSQRAGDLRDVPARWSTFNEYFRLLEKRGLTLNFATLAGHGNIRGSVVGYADRRAGADEMAEMKRLRSEAVRSGALGLSTGLIYPPGVYAGEDEIAELARAGAEAAGPASGGAFIYASHMRSEGDRLIEALEEALSIGRKSGLRTHISHIKTAGRENWDKAGAAVSLLEAARAAGQQVTCDRYPYTAASTGLDAVLPPWVFADGASRELERLRDPAARQRIKSELRGAGPGDRRWQGVRVAVVRSEENRWMEGQSVEEIAGRQGKDPVDALMDILVAEELMADAVLYSMSEDNLRMFLSLPYVMVGSDSASRPLSGRGKPHPRGFGTFPRFLSGYAQGLPEGVRKVTALPAETFGLRGRGAVREGCFADLAIFDPAALRDTATYENPYSAPEGVRHVIVNGVPVVLEGELTGRRPGRVLRHGL